MRTFLVMLVALLVAGCATAPANVTAVFDHKYNTYSFVQKSSPSEFVGTSAQPEKAKPGWYRYGHP
jgi:hypothetical protein